MLASISNRENTGIAAGIISPISLPVIFLLLAYKNHTATNAMLVKSSKATTLGRSNTFLEAETTNSKAVIPKNIFRLAELSTMSFFEKT
ncbi:MULTISPECIES: hypothetical protein [unclassified Acetobacter]|uniref:hypothetical protein n=1 Tax=unclassified Acetobacter TaxID=2628570 RepID=UPI001EE2E24D|nr:MULTISPECIES: hypothetical protein [unclassified Acetobacter]